MKPAAFDYVRAESLDQCLHLLAQYGDDACVLAGGQSLIPSLALRLQSPRVLVDINHVAEIGGEPMTQESLICVPALTRHADLIRSSVVSRELPLLSVAAPMIANAAVRHRGTIGGSLAHGDPTSELPACALALNATIVLRSAAGGERRVSASSFWKGLFENDRRADEIIVRCEFPKSAHLRFAFREFARRKGDYATVGVAGVAERVRGALSCVRIVFFGVSDRPELARRTGAAIEGSSSVDAAIAEALTAVNKDVEPVADVWLTAAYKSHLMKVFLEDVVRELYR